MTDDGYIGDATITITVEELSDRLMAGMVAWMLHGRGAEGMSLEEVISNVQRLPPARWLSVFVHDTPYAIAVLKAADQAGLDLRNTVLPSDRPPEEDEIWRLTSNDPPE